MSSRIVMAVYALEGSPKIGYAKRTLSNLLKVTNFNKHELFISDNGSCPEMIQWYDRFKSLYKKAKFKPENLTISLNGENLGTSGAVNLGIRDRKPGQFIIKMDDDMVIHTTGWVDLMEDCMARYTKLGIAGVKRRELIQRPDHPEAQYQTKLIYLPHQRGLSWTTLELCNDIIGSTTMYHPDLLDACGYAFQPSNYGMDDVLWSIRSQMAGFTNAFIPEIKADHIDTGEGEFVMWKQKHAGEIMDEFIEIKEDYLAGVRDIYYDGGFSE